MRRVTLKKAKTGMEIARPVLDLQGNMLLPAGVELMDKHIEFLQGRGVYELLIEDQRVPELTIKPLIKQEMHRESIDAVRHLLSIDRDPSEKKNMKDSEMYAARVEVDRLSYATVQSVLMSLLGEPDLTGCATAEDFHFVLPVQITALSILLAKEAGFDQSELINVSRAAMLENIGYIWTPPEIWQNEENLSEDERKIFEKHPIHGYEAVSQLDRTPPQVAEAILQHHERWNGSGYPHGTKGWDISPIAQIIGITETYYEATSARTFRAPYKPMDAFENVMAYLGEWFDPELVQIFARRVPVYPSGIMVKLNNNETGIIMDVNLGHIGRPIIRVCYDIKGNPVDTYDIDLSDSEHQLKLIAEILDI